MLQVDSKVLQLYAYLYILFSDSFPLCSSLCYTTGPCCLSLLSLVACIFIPDSSFIPFPLNFVFCISEPLLFSFQHFLRIFWAAREVSSFWFFIPVARR